MDGGPWQRVLTRTLATTYVQTCTLANFYTFRLTATDRVSNAVSVEARASVPRTTKYYHHGGVRIALRAQGVVYYLHSDHLGSVSLITDHASRITAQQRFLPYGGVRYTQGTFPTDVGFTGHRGHPDLGLIFMRARYYHPALGRFVSADTVVPDPLSPQLFNRYSYAGNNPILYCDPTGHCLTPFCIGEIIVGVAVVVVAWNAMRVNAGDTSTVSEMPTAQPAPTSTPTPVPTSTPTPSPTATPEPPPTSSPGSFGLPVTDGYIVLPGQGFTWDSATGTGHYGIDIISVRDPGRDVRPYDDLVSGREVFAIADGVVLGWYYPDVTDPRDPSDPSLLLSGHFGYTVEVQHGEERWQYTHVYPLRDKSGNIIYPADSTVSRGSLIGYYAQIGQSTAPHLHLTRKVRNSQGSYTRSYADPALVLP